MKIHINWYELTFCECHLDIFFEKNPVLTDRENFFLPVCTRAVLNKKKIPSPAQMYEKGDQRACAPEIFDR